MPHVTLNGVTVPCVSGSRSFEYAGEPFARQFSGQHVRTTKARKSMWSFTTGPLSQAESAALQRLIAGEGYSFPIRTGPAYFSGRCGSSQGHFATEVGTISDFGGEGVFIGANDGNKYTTRAYATLPAGMTEWTIFGNMALYDGSPRRHIYTSTGSKWQNNVAMAATTGQATDRISYDSSTGLFEFKGGAYHPTIGAPNGGADWTATTARGLDSRCHITNRTAKVTTAGTTGGSIPTFNASVGGTVTDGSVVWTTVNTNASTATLPQVVHMLPYVVPSTWVAGLDAFLSTTIGAGNNSPAIAGGELTLPNVVASGTGFQVPTVCRGEVTGVDTITGASGAVLEVISFGLMEA